MGEPVGEGGATGGDEGEDEGDASGEDEDEDADEDADETPGRPETPARISYDSVADPSGVVTLIVTRVSSPSRASPTTTTRDAASAPTRDAAVAPEPSAETCNVARGSNSVASRIISDSVLVATA